MDKKKIVLKNDVCDYNFVPQYNRWVDMEMQRNIVKKLENITKNEENRSE